MVEKKPIPEAAPTAAELNALEPISFDSPVRTELVQAGFVATVAREEAEIKGAIVQAKHFPRDEMASYTKLLRSCERPSFAEGARYVFPRAGQNVEGPSVNLAREIARCWGNVRYGLRLVSLDEENVHVKGWAMDLENNAYVEMEDKFARLVYRKKGGWVKPDERDLRELVNRRGAICVRNALLQIMPPDVVDDALGKAKETLVKAARGELKQDAQAATRRIVLAFAEFGVSADHLRQYIKHDIPPISETEMTDLRGIYAAIRDGQSKPSDFFPVNGGHVVSEGASELNEAVKEQKNAEK